MIVRTQVLVAGGGPVGAVAAYRLAQMGIDVILLETRADCPEDMRASTFHPPSLDMMGELGVLDDGVPAFRDFAGQCDNSPFRASSVEVLQEECDVGLATHLCLPILIHTNGQKNE